MIGLNYFNGLNSTLRGQLRAAFIFFTLVINYSCNTRTDTSLTTPRIIEKYVYFSDSLRKDRFIVELIDRGDKQETLEIEIRNYKDSLLFKNAWSVSNWVSVAHKINYLYSNEERSQRLAAIYNQSLAPGNFGQMGNFLVTRIIDDPNGILKNEFKSAPWRPVYCLFYADAVLVYSKSLNRVVEINAVSKPLLEKYLIAF